MLSIYINCDHLFRYKEPTACDDSPCMNKGICELNITDHKDYSCNCEYTGYKGNQCHIRELSRCMQIHAH